MANLRIAQPRSLIVPRRGFRKPSKAIFDRNEPINRGLGGYWLFGRTAGSETNLVGVQPYSGPTAAFSSGVSTAASHHGGLAQHLTGASSQYIDFLNSGTPLVPATANWTIRIWANPASVDITNSNGIFSQYIAVPNNGRILLRINTSSKWELFLGSSDGGALGTVGVASSASVSLNTFTHVVVTRFGKTFTLYVNGVSVGLNTDATTRTLLQCGNLIGCFGNDGSTYNGSPRTGFFDGAIEGLKMAGRAWSPSEVARDFAEPYAGIFEAGPRWRVGVAAAGFTAVNRRTLGPRVGSRSYY